MTQFIIKLPENSTFEGLSDAAREVILHVKGEFPIGELIGSKAVDGYVIKLLTCNLDRETFENILADGYLMMSDEGKEVMVDLELDWEVMASEGQTISQPEILPFMLDKLIFEDGEIVDYQPVTDLTDILQTYAGHSWSY